MKVVIAGASGSGKTTLAKALAKHFGWEFTENSAGLIIDDQWKEMLSTKFGYEGNWGQRKVINMSHKEPQFGIAFQESILKARKALIELPGDHVYDRSSLDPIVFYLNQAVHNWSQENSEHFIHRCITGMRNVDCILRIPLQNPEKQIENNESRVNNWYFQKKVDSLFDDAIDIMMAENRDNPHLLGGKVILIARCPTWEWDKRFEWGTQMIQRVVSGNF